MDVRVTRPLPTLNTVSLHPTKESHLRTVILDVIIHIMKELNRDTFVELIVLYYGKGFCRVIKHMNKQTHEGDSNHKS